MPDPSKLYVGRPCPHGHDGLRFRRNGNCVECNRENARERMASKYDGLTNAGRREWVFRKDVNRRKRRIKSLERDLREEITVG